MEMYRKHINRKYKWNKIHEDLTTYTYEGSCIKHYLAIIIEIKKDCGQQTVRD